MCCDNVLFFLLPVELLSFVLFNFLDFTALFFKSGVSFIQGSVDVISEVVSFRSSMVVNLKRTLWSKEVRIGNWMVVVWDVFSVKGVSYKLVLTSVHCCFRTLFDVDTLCVSTLNTLGVVVCKQRNLEVFAGLVLSWVHAQIGVVPRSSLLTFNVNSVFVLVVNVLLGLIFVERISFFFFQGFVQLVGSV